MASLTLRNTHKEIKKAKSEHLFAHLLFSIFKIMIKVGLDFEFGLGLSFGLDLGLEFGLCLGLG